MKPEHQCIEDLVNMFKKRQLALPEMQRSYVWKTKQVRDLIDSLYRGYPSGSILLWDADSLPELKRPTIVDKDSNGIGGRPPLLLLDGQQRITSLANILTGLPIRVREGKKPVEKFVDIYFNVRHPDESQIDESDELEVGDHVEAKWEDGEFYPGVIEKIENDKIFVQFDDGDTGWSEDVRALSEKLRRDLFFRIKEREIANNPDWISVTKLYSQGVAAILRDLKIDHNSPDYDKIYSRLNHLYNVKSTYFYPVQVIKNKTYKDVTQIFKRVNSAGTKLKGSDLALAQLTSIWPGSMKVLEEFAGECHEQQYFLDENFLIRCIVCLATEQALFDQIGSLRKSQFEESWEETKRGVEKTINFLKNNAYADTSSALPSTNLMLPLIVYSARNSLTDNDRKTKGFLFWFFNAALWARYSSSFEAKLTQDIARLSEDKPWIHLIDAVWQAVGKDRRLTVEDVRGKGSGSPIFSLMYMLARSKGAIDYDTGQVVAYSNFGKKNQIEFDHIFPKSKLNKKLSDDLKNDEKKKVINEVANLAFLTKEGNLIKTNDDPEEYFPKVIKKYGSPDILKKQEIPTDLALMKYPNYFDFLDERATQIAQSINDLIQRFAEK